MLHLHTQLNRSLPWSSIDMDFMNLNQAAHGDREFGYVQTRLAVPRKTAAGNVRPRGDLAEMLRTELLVIDADTTPRQFTKEIRWNQAYYRLAQGL